MSAELLKLFTEDEVQYLKTGQIRDLKPVAREQGSYTNDGLKCSLNTYIHPYLNQKFLVEITAGNTEEEHRKVQAELRFAAKVVSNAGAELKEIDLTDTDESILINAAEIADVQSENRTVKIRFALAHPEKYQAPYQVQFLLEPSQADGTTRSKQLTSETLGPDSDEEMIYDFAYQARKITVWVNPHSQLDTTTNYIMATLSWQAQGLPQAKTERRPDDSAEHPFITLDSDGVFTDTNIEFKVYAQVFGNARCDVSGIYS